MEKKGLEVCAWCIMPSHVHIIISSHQDKLPNIVRDMKSFTSGAMKDAISSHPGESRKEWMLWMMERAGRKNPHNNDWQFWQDSNQPIVLFSLPVIKQKLDYLHNNPVESGFVNSPEDYVYSSARDYAGETGMLEGLSLLH